MIYDKQIIRGKIPSKSNCYKIVTLSGHGSLAKQRVLKEYEKTFYVQCGLRDKNIKGFFKINVDVYHENLRPDLETLSKFYLTACKDAKL